MVVVTVGAVTVKGTMPENTVWTGGVMVDVVVTTVRDGTVVVVAGAVTRTTTGDAETVTVVVNGPSGPTRLARARLAATAMSRRTCGEFRRAMVDAGARVVISDFRAVVVQLGIVVFVLVIETVVAVRCVCRKVFVLVTVVDGWSVMVPEVAFGTVTVIGGSVVRSVSVLVVIELNVETGVTVPVTVSVV